jgi:hypothetical protein
MSFFAVTSALLKAVSDATQNVVADVLPAVHKAQSKRVRDRQKRMSTGHLVA